MTLNVLSPTSSFTDVWSNDGTFARVIDDTAATRAAMDACCCGVLDCPGCFALFKDTLIATLTAVGNDGDCSCFHGWEIILTKVAADDPDTICDANAITQTGDGLPRWSGSYNYCGALIKLCLAPCILPSGSCDPGKIPFTLLLDYGAEELDGDCLAIKDCDDAALVFNFGTAPLTTLCSGIVTMGDFIVTISEPP